MGIPTFNPATGAFIAKKQGRWSASAGLFASPAKFCFLSLSLYLFPCFQLPSNVAVHRFVRGGSILYNPPVRKSAFKSFDHFLI